MGAFVIMDTGPYLFANMSRMLAAYRLRVALRSKQLGATAFVWDEPISIEEQRHLLLSEDKHRISPFPYPGLRPFDSEEGEIFFGRERNVEEVRSLLSRKRVVAVLGGSGSGKSSLLRAGLLPHLNSEHRIPGRIGNWYKTEFRPRTRPLYELSSALAEQLFLPLLRLRGPALAQDMGLPTKIDVNGDRAASWLRDRIHERLTEAARLGRTSLLDAFTHIVDHQLDRWDNMVTGGRRLAEPSLFLLVDQLEEAFRPEVSTEERDALLNLIVDLGKYGKGGLFLALTMRSEELYRCAEHRGLSDVVVGNGYQLELLDPTDEGDKTGLRLAIIQPARNVFDDWGLGHCLSHPDAPFAPGMPDLLLKGAARLSRELEHRPDQLPLLQHALQTTWHEAMRRWSREILPSQRLEISPDDLPGFEKGVDFPDLGACLNVRADSVARRAAHHFEETSGATDGLGEQALAATFRALARRDGNGNWARRFASRQDISAFLDADSRSPLAVISKELRWKGIQRALNSFILRGYLTGGGGRDYDISHEALIRNWRRFQDWLRDPQEVAYCLTRVLFEVDPKTFQSEDDDKKISLIPADVAERVAMVSTNGPLPTSWGEDQVESVLEKPAIRQRWGSTKSEALKKIAQVSAMADEARNRLREKLFRSQFVEEQKRIRAKRIRFALTIVGIALLLGGLSYYLNGKIILAQERHVENIRRITLLASEFLGSDGPPRAILVEGKIQNELQSADNPPELPIFEHIFLTGVRMLRGENPPEFPDAERLLLTSLHQLREERVLTGHHLDVQGISYSPNGSALVTADPGGLRFWKSDNGDLLDALDVSYLARENLKFDGSILGLQWGPEWLAIGTRDQTLLLAPCSRENLRSYFVVCDGQTGDLLRLVGDGRDRAGTAKFSKDGTWMVTGSFGSRVTRWNLSAAGIDRQWESDGKLAMANAFAISQDMKVVAAGIGGSGVQLIDSGSGVILGSVQPPISGQVSRGSSTAIAFNPNDLAMFAAAFQDGSIFVWEDWKRNTAPIELKGTGETAYQLGFSGDGSFLASASDDGIARLWTTESMKTDTPTELHGHKGPVWAIAISPDGKHIASGSADKVVVLWNRHSAFYRAGDREPSLSSDNGPADALPEPTTSSCSDGLPLPPDFGTVAACLQSKNHRTVVASAKGQVEVFNKDRVPVDGYRVESDVIGLEFEGDRLVVKYRTKSVKRPFFDDLNALISYSLKQVPFAGAKQITLPSGVLCTLQRMKTNCDPSVGVSYDELSQQTTK